MTSAEYFREARVMAALAIAFRDVGLSLHFRHYKNRAIYFLAKGFEALAASASDKPIQL